MRWRPSTGEHRGTEMSVLPCQHPSLRKGVITALSRRHPPASLYETQCTGCQVKAEYTLAPVSAAVSLSETSTSEVSKRSLTHWRFFFLCRAAVQGLCPLLPPPPPHAGEGVVAGSLSCIMVSTVKHTTAKPAKVLGPRTDDADHDESILIFYFVL